MKMGRGAYALPPHLSFSPRVQPVDGIIDAVAVEVAVAALRAQGVERGEAPSVGVVVILKKAPARWQSRAGARIQRAPISIYLYLAWIA